MKRQTIRGNRLFRRALLFVTVLFLLAMVVQVGMAQAGYNPATVSSGTLTVGKSTTPAGGQDFWITAASFQGSWGSIGSRPGQYRQPRDVDMDAAGNFYVSDHRGSRVQKLDANGNFLLAIGSRGRGSGKLLRPNEVAISGSVLIVTDTDNHRIATFNTNGTFIKNWGTLGSGDGQFRYPQGVAVDSVGNIYIADTFNQRIQVFSPAGAYLRQWGTLGSGPGQFRYPVHIDFDASDHLYVADSNNNRIQVFDNQGVFIRQIGGPGAGPGKFNLPVGLDVGDDGFLYVSDTYNNRIQKLTSTGEYVGQWGQVAGGAAISRPNGLVAVGSKVYASDIDANRIQIFSQASFMLDDAQQLSTGLPAGTYDVTEAPKAGWTLSSATCDAGNPTSIPGGVRMALADGVTVLCSFSNSQ